MNTIALPRSGCFATRRVGTPAMTQGGNKSRSVLGASRRPVSQRASIRTTESFAISAGCPNRTPPIASHDRSLAAVPAPTPANRVQSSTTMPIPYAYGVAHSSSRGDVRNIRTVAMMPTASQMSCLCQIVSTKEGTSVWPAE